MKKIITLLFACSFLFGYAQKFQLTDGNGNSYANGQTISEIINESDLDKLGRFVVSIHVENIDNSELTVQTLRTNDHFVGGMELEICFGSCYLENVYLIPPLNDLFPIGVGESLPFEIKLYPNGNLGLCKFKFDFWSVEDPNDKITLYVNIDMQPLGVKEQNRDVVSLSAFPNPVKAGSNINVSFTLADKSNNKLVIRNILGAVVMSMPINSSETTVSVDTSPLVQGVYFYAIENKNQISIAKKLIVK